MNLRLPVKKTFQSYDDSNTYFNGVFDGWKTHQINDVATNLKDS